MYPRPIAYPQWPVTGPNAIQPTAELAATGWAPGVAPDAQNFNWLLGDCNAWIQYLDVLTNTGLPLSVIRLINGGNWSFNASSGQLAWSADFNLAIPPLPDSANDIPAGNVTMADGQVAYVTANLPTFSQGDTSTTSNPNQITNMNFTGNISPGYSVVGPGIPASTTVLGVGPNFVTLSNNVTSNNSGANYTFSPVGSLSVTVVNETAFLPTINTILIARRAGNVIYLGVNAPQMVLRDGEFKTLIGSGYFSVYQAPAGQNLAAGTLVYISPGSSDGGRIQGALYPLDVSAANEAVRGTYAGVVITSLTTGQTATVLYSGFYAGVGFTAGDVYYADPNTPGGITPTQPNGAGQKIEPVAFAVTSTAILFTGVASGVTSLQFPIFQEDEFVGNGTRTSFTPTQTPLSAGNIFVFLDGLIVPNTLWNFTGGNVVFNTAPATAQSIELKYVLASQTYLAGAQATPTNPSGDFQTYVLPFVPTNQASTFVYVDGTIVPSSMWSLTVGGGSSEVTFNAPLSTGQSVYVTTFTSSASGGGGGGGGTITGAENVGGGVVGLVRGVTGTLIDIKTFVDGTNTTVVDNGNGTVQVNATGGGGGGITTNGSYGSPVAVVPSIGIAPTTSMDQIWWVTSSILSSGAQPLTSTPQIAAGTTVGQRLTLFGVTNGSGGYISIANGNGVLSNGTFGFITGQCVVYVWDGAQWSFQSNAI
jgi:hypothetical protein